MRTKTCKVFLFLASLILLFPMLSFSQCKSDPAVFDSIASRISQALASSPSRTVVVDEVKTTGSGNRSFARRFQNEITVRLSSNSTGFLVRPSDDFIAARSRMRAGQGRTSEQLKRIGSELKIDAVLEAEVIVADTGCEVSWKFVSLANGTLFGGSSATFERSSDAVASESIAAIATPKTSSPPAKVSKDDREKTVGSFRLTLDNCSREGERGQCSLTLKNLSSSSGQPFRINQGAYAIDRTGRKVFVTEVEIGGIVTTQSDVPPDAALSIILRFQALSPDAGELASLVISGEAVRRTTRIYLGDQTRAPGYFNLTFKNIKLSQ